MIELKGISKKYKDHSLFENLDLTIRRKKTKIKGTNGIGKSVLLKIIVGYSKADAGEVLINGEELSNIGDFLPDTGVSINAPHFIKSWSGLENLEYLRAIKNISTHEEMIELVQFFSLEGDINKKYKTYSLGMQQKMRIIQALLDKPTYLILDEPFDALDKGTKSLAKDKINRYLNENEDSILIYTSHDEADDSYADDIYEINNKKLELLSTLD